jgi:hypothetical protein
MAHLPLSPTIFLLELQNSTRGCGLFLGWESGAQRHSFCRHHLQLGL